MAGIELPQRLHRGIEGAAGVAGGGGGLGEKPHEVGGGRVQHAVAVEAAQRGVGAVEAEDTLQTGDFLQAQRDQAVGFGRVGMGDAQAGVGAERHAAPDADGNSFSAQQAVRQQRQAGCDGADGEEAASGQWTGEDGLHQCSPSAMVAAGGARIWSSGTSAKRRTLPPLAWAKRSAADLSEKG